MHVVYVFELGGIETFISQLYNGIDKDRIDLTLVVLSDKKLGVIDLLNSKDNLIIFKNTKKGLFSRFNLLKELADKIKNIKPDIIHTHHEHYVSLFVFIANKISRINAINVRTVHSGGSFYTLQKSLKCKAFLAIEKLTLLLFKVNLVSVSDGVHKNNLKHFSGLSNSITKIYNGIAIKDSQVSIGGDSELKSKYKNKNENSTSTIVTYVSRLNEGKNHIFLIDVWAQVVKHSPSSKLFLAGDGPLKGKIEEHINSLGLGDSVVLLGLINNVPELLAITDIGVFPSEYEGLSIALLEKFAKKIPVVASDIDAFRAVGTNYKDCVLVDLNSKDKFSKEIVNLIEDKVARKSVGKEAYKTALKYSIEKTITSYENLYFKLLIEK